MRLLPARDGGVDAWVFNHVLGYRFARTGAKGERELRLRLADWLRKEVANALHPEARHGR